MDSETNSPIAAKDELYSFIEASGDLNVKWFEEPEPGRSERLVVFQFDPSRRRFIVHFDWLFWAWHSFHALEFLQGPWVAGPVMIKRGLMNPVSVDMFECVDTEEFMMWVDVSWGEISDRMKTTSK